MFEFLFKKKNKVEFLMYDYLENFQFTLDNFRKAVDSCIEEPHCEAFNFLVEQTHKYESKADDIIDEINNLMYGKVLIPDSRGDIMNLLISLDKIPHILEKVLFIIKYQKLVIPDELVLDIQDLLRISLESCELLSKQVVLFIKKETGIRSFLNTIDTNESHCDHIERRIIKKIFESDINDFIKLQLKELIVNMGDISDQAERVSKHVNVLSMKRRI
ncbi:MAG: DUF47 family protein [Thermodesulfobacteriota bacterium]|nr:DUF47 family protein [Thermodesulfobacteriota bacterium]